MEGVIEKASSVILSALQNAEPRLTNIPASGAVGGFVLWEGFADLDAKGRQDTLWRALKENLSPEEQQALTAIFTLTPEEFELTQDEEE